MPVVIRRARTPRSRPRVNDPLACAGIGLLTRPTLAPSDRRSLMPVVIRQARTPRCGPRLNDFQESEGMRPIGQVFVSQH